MRAVVQRVDSAWVDAEGARIAEIGRGLLILLGMGNGDTESDMDIVVDKVAGLRIFEDAEGKMNLSVKEIGGSAIVVSQFTLYGDVRKGRRPSFTEAAPAGAARDMFEMFLGKMRTSGVETLSGRFQAMMKVGLVNDGPVTILIDSRKAF